MFYFSRLRCYWAPVSILSRFQLKTVPSEYLDHEPDIRLRALLIVPVNFPEPFAFLSSYISNSPVSSFTLPEKYVEPFSICHNVTLLTPTHSAVWVVLSFHCNLASFIIVTKSIKIFTTEGDMLEYKRLKDFSLKLSRIALENVSTILNKRTSLPEEMVSKWYQSGINT